MIRRERSRVAVLGLGLAGGRLHLPALRRLGASVVLAADPDPATHRAVSGIPVTRDWREVLGCSATAVVVATPPHTHGELGVAVVHSGRHLLVEKPMTVSSQQARALVQAAVSVPVVVQVGFAYRFHPLWRRVRSLLARRALAPPLRMSGRFTGDTSDPVLELSPHHVDLASWLLGSPPVSAEALGEERISVTWADGSVLVGTYGPGAPADRVEIQTARSHLVVDRLAGYRLRGDVGLLAGAPVPELVILRALWPEWERSYLASMRAFLAAAAGRRAPAGADVHAGADAVRVSEALVRSRSSGRPEPVAAR